MTSIRSVTVLYYKKSESYLSNGKTLQWCDEKQKVNQFGENCEFFLKSSDILIDALICLAQHRII